MGEENYLNEEELKEVYQWVDTFELSRIKRNINRDFADAVLVSEILNFYYPNLVELHNYSSAGGLEQKIVQWKLLRKKVLKKIEFELTNDEILSLSRSERGFIEVFLLKLKRFVE